MMCDFRADCKRELEFSDGCGVTQGAVHFLLFLHEAGDGEGIVVARGFGDLAAEVALAVLKLAAAQGADGSVKKLGGERLVLLHEDGHEEGAILVGEREGHEIGAFGESLENGVDERFRPHALGATARR